MTRRDWLELLAAGIILGAWGFALLLGWWLV